jgi:hypothetical protein
LPTPITIITRRPGPLAPVEVSYVPTGRPGVGRRWIHGREIPPLIRWPGRRRGRAIRCDHPARAGRRPVRRGLLLRGPGGGSGRHTAHGGPAPRDRAAAMRSPLPRLACRPGGRPRHRVRAAREFRRRRLVPRRSRPSRPSDTRPVSNTAPDMAMASDEVPSLPFLRPGRQRRRRPTLSWEKKSLIPGWRLRRCLTGSWWR